MAKKDPYLDKNLKLLESINTGLDAITTSLTVLRACSLAARVLVEGNPSFGAQHAIETQLVRSLNSIAANYTEGKGYADQQQVIRFFKMARGSAYESLIHAKCLNKYEEEITRLCEDFDKEFAALVIEAVSRPETDETGE